MHDSETNEKKPIKEVEKLYARKKKLEHVSSKQAIQQINEKLKKAQADWDKTFDAIADWVTMIDLKGRILRTNRSVEDFTGMSSEVILGQSLCKLVHGSTTHLPNCPLQKMLRTCKRESNEIRLEGKNRWLMVTVDPLTDTKGQITGAVHIARDITEYRKVLKVQKESEEQYRSIFDTAPNLILSVDTDGIIKDCNKRIKDILGYNKDEIIGRSIAKIIHPDYMEKAKTCLSQITTERTAYPKEYRMVRKDNEVIDVEVNAAGIKDGHGRYAEGICIIEDITQRKKIEHTLQASEERYRNLFENAGEAIITFDLQGRITEANKFIEEYGYSREKLMSKSLFDFVPEYEKERAESDFQNLLAGNYVHGEMDVITPLGMRTVSYRDTPITKEGHVIGIQAILTDITEKKKTEQRDKEYIRKLQYLSESAMEFINLTTDQDIYKFMANKVHNLCEGSIVAVNTYDEESGSLCVNSLVGLGKYAEAITKIMGKNPVGRSFPLDDDAKEGLSQGKLHKIPEGIYDLSPGIPRPVCQAIEKLLGLGDVYAMGLNNMGHLYGSITVLTRAKTGLENHNLIETFMNQAAVAIHRWKAESALQRSEAKWRSLTENSPDHILILDRDGKIQFVNRPLELSRQEIMDALFYEYIPQEYRSIAKKCVEEVFRTGQFREFETEYLTPSGERKIFDIKLGPVKEGDQVSAVTVAARDVTKRRKDEEALKESEERLKILFEYAPDGIYLNDLEGKFVDGNKAAEDLVGYSREDLIGKNFAEGGLLSPDELPRALANLEKLAKGEPTGPDEFTLKRKDGKSVTVEIRTFPIRLKGQILSLGIARDITERKKAEEVLRESEEKYRELFNNRSNASFLFDAETRQFEDANQALLDLFGYTKEEFTKLNVDDVSAEKEKTKKNIQRVVEGKTKVLDVSERQLIKKDGTTFLGEISSGSFISKRRKKIIGTLRDITERKRAEEAYHSLVDHSIQGLAIFQESRVVFANQAMADITGYTVEEMLNSSPKQVWVFVHPEDRELVWSRHMARLNGEEVPNRYWIRGIRKDGSICWLELNANRIEYNRKPAIQVAYVDVTERKRAEENLRKNEEQLSSIFNEAVDGIIYADRKGNVLKVNPAFTEITGIQPQEVVGKSAFDLIKRFVKTKDIPRLIYKVHTALKGEQVGLYELEINGKVVEISTPVLGSGLMGVTGVIRDITARRKAEEALRESEKMFRSIFETSLIGIAICSPDKKWLYMNDQICKILGYSDQELRQTTWEKLTHPDDLEADISQFNRLLAGEIENYALEKRFIRKDNSVIYARIYISRKSNQCGAMEYNIGLLEDITEQKKAQEQIQKLARFPSEDPNPVVRISEGGNILYSNKASAPLLEAFECDRLPHLSEYWREFVLAAVRSQQIRMSEINCGEKVFSLTFAPVPNTNYVNLYGLDITNHKKVEKELINHQSKLRALASERLMVEERERKRIALLLHDEVCQKLVLNKFALESSMKLTSDPKLLASLKITAEGIGETIEKTDSLLFELSNPVLREFGLVTALHKYLNEHIHKKHGIEFEFESSKGLKTVDEDIMNCLYRITKELLTNVVKHAKAHKVKVLIREIENQIRISVQDDGIGFTDEKKDDIIFRAARFGLFSVREQLEYFGGYLKIESEPGRGSTATVVVPIKQ